MSMFFLLFIWCSFYSVFENRCWQTDQSTSWSKGLWASVSLLESPDCLRHLIMWNAPGQYSCYLFSTFWETTPISTVYFILEKWVSHWPMRKTIRALHLPELCELEIQGRHELTDILLFFSTFILMNDFFLITANDLFFKQTT